MAYTGKNDPCICGSGLKYKQCCANRVTIEKLISEKIDNAYQAYVTDNADKIHNIIAPLLLNAKSADINIIENLSSQIEEPGFMVYIFKVLNEYFPEQFTEKYAFALYNEGKYFSVALPYFIKLAKVKPDSYQINLALINIYNKLNLHAEAILHADGIIRNNPGEERAYILKIDALSQMNDIENLEKLFNEVKIKLSKNQLIYNKHIQVYFEKADFNTAEQRCLEAILKWPDNVSLLNQRVVCLVKLSRYKEALEILDNMPLHDNVKEKLISLQSRQSIAYRFSDKEVFFDSIDKQIELNPKFDICGKFKKATFFSHVIPSEESIVEMRNESMKILSEIINSPDVIDDVFTHVNLANFYLAYHGYNDKELQLMFAAAYYKCCPRLAAYSTHCSQLPPIQSKKIRIGIISTFLKMHTIGKFNLGFIEHLPREKFDIIIFTMENMPKDPITEKINEFANKVINLPGNFGKAQELISNEEVDILFYTDIGMDPFTYYMAFSRLAPVQCVTWGHPDTTGLPNIDYFISAADAEPDDADIHYSEKLIRLKNLPTYYYRPVIPDATGFKENYYLPEDKKIYACPQSIFKFHPHFDEALGQLLLRDKNAILVIIGGGNAEWYAPLTTRMKNKIPAELLPRIFILPKMPMDDYLKLLQVSDVILDPPYFGGGNTSYEAFACGKGIVTWPGPFMRGRVTLACYRQMGIDDLIANSADEYLELAYRMANDLEFKKNIEEQIILKRDILFENYDAIAEISDFFATAYDAALNHKKLDFWRWKNEN